MILQNGKITRGIDGTNTLFCYLNISASGFNPRRLDFVNLIAMGDDNRLINPLGGEFPFFDMDLNRLSFFLEDIPEKGFHVQSLAVCIEPDNQKLFFAIRQIKSLKADAVALSGNDADIAQLSIHFSVNIHRLTLEFFGVCKQSTTVY